MINIYFHLRFQGCLTEVEEFFHKHFTILAIVGIGVAGIQVYCMYSTLTCIVTETGVFACGSIPASQPLAQST